MAFGFLAVEAEVMDTLPEQIAALVGYIRAASRNGAWLLTTAG